jgi:protein-export membrane protein SecD
MLLYYRVPGLAASLALLIFILLNLAAYKLLPVTLTLPAITGFLISIGTAVDGNILIFERIKEELRAGKPLGTALDNGFSRAWGSIRDSNTSTIIICAVLFFFGQTPGASVVSGFALTLILGLIINLFTATIVTRTFLYIFAHWLQKPLAERPSLLGA